MVIPFRRRSAIPFVVLGLIMVIFGVYFILTGTYVFFVSGDKASSATARLIGVLVAGVGWLILGRVLSRVISSGPAVLIQDDTVIFHAAFTPRAVRLRRADVLRVTNISSLGIWPIRFRAFRVLSTKPDTPFKNHSQLIIDICVPVELSRLREQLISWVQLDEL